MRVLCLGSHGAWRAGSRYKRRSLLFSGATDKERRWFLDKGDVVGDLGAGSFSLDKKEKERLELMGLFLRRGDR